MHILVGAIHSRWFNTGQITFPKKWRSQFDTNHFIAEEKEGSLVITPVFSGNKESSVFYEDASGFGVYFPQGDDPKKLISENEKYTLFFFSDSSHSSIINIDFRGRVYK